MGKEHTSAASGHTHHNPFTNATVPPEGDHKLPIQNNAEQDNCRIWREHICAAHPPPKQHRRIKRDACGKPTSRQQSQYIKPI